jgi:CelD/BcsL family acetyltransferase involved in cellulose biosynthesis
LKKILEARSLQSPIQVKRLSDAAAFAKLQTGWEEILKQNPVRDAFLTWEWNYAWWQAYSASKELWLLTARNEDGLLGIAPLALIRKKRAGMQTRVLTSLGDESLDVGGFIVPHHIAQVQCAFVDFLISNQAAWDVLELNEFLQADAATTELKECLKQKGFAAYQQKRVHYFLPLNGTWQEYLGGISQNLRGDLRRKIRRMEQQGKLEYVHHQGSQISPQDMARVYEINQRGRHASLFKSTQERKFQDELRERMRLSGWLDLHLLFLNGKAVAYRSGFYFDKRIEDWRNAFDLDHFEFSPGKILLMFMIENAYKRGCEEVDFLRGDEDYKQRWKTSERDYLHLRFVHPRRLIAWLLYIYLPRVKAWLNNFKRR